MSAAAGAAEIGLPRDAAYLREHYLQWLVFRSGWRRWLLMLALLMTVAGVWLAGSSTQAGIRMSAVIIIVAGLSQCLLPWFEFRRWKRQACGGFPRMPDLVLSVCDGVLRFGAGPDVRFDALGEVVRVWRGVFVYQQGRAGRHLYLPDRWSARPDVRELLAAWKPAAT